MPAAIGDLISAVTASPTADPIVDQLAAPGHSIGGTSIGIDAGTNWTTATPIHFSMYGTQTVGSLTVKDPSTQSNWKGILSGTTISSMVLTGGSDRAYTTGAYVEITPTSRYAYDLYTWAMAHGNQDGSLKASAVQTALGLGSSTLNGWNALGYTFNSVTYNGNRSYTCVASGVDLTGTLSAGMRVRTTRTVAAPVNSTLLNGTTQFWSKTSPAGMTYTNNFVVSAHIKLSSYPSAESEFVSRYNGTSGWEAKVMSTGQVKLTGRNAGAANFSEVTSYQSLPLNKWVHITAQLDMATFTATPTTSYVMFDGVDVPASVARGGTNPTALIQAGNLEIGSENGGANPFPGKISQVAIYSAKVTQATIQASISQGLVGTETSLISAYSFNGNANDLNTTNANNLTSNGAATATNADSPFGGQAGGTISSTLDYGIIQSVTFSTNTTVVIQVPEGCTIDTKNGISAVAYSSNTTPYGFPRQTDKWTLRSIYRTILQQASPAVGTWYNFGQLNLPLGEWNTGFNLSVGGDRITGDTNVVTTLSDANNTELDRRYTTNIEVNNSSNAFAQAYLEEPISQTTQANRYLNAKAVVTGLTNIYTRGDESTHVIYAKNAYL